MPAGKRAIWESRNYRRISDGAEKKAENASPVMTRQWEKGMSKSFVTNDRMPLVVLSSHWVQVLPSAEFWSFLGGLPNGSKTRSGLLFLGFVLFCFVFFNPQMHFWQHSLKWIYYRVALNFIYLMFMFFFIKKKSYQSSISRVSFAWGVNPGQKWCWTLLWREILCS